MRWEWQEAIMLYTGLKTQAAFGTLSYTIPARVDALWHVSLALCAPVFRFVCLLGSERPEAPGVISRAMGTAMKKALCHFLISSLVGGHNVLGSKASHHCL